MLRLFNRSKFALLAVMSSACLLSACIEPAPPSTPPSQDTAARFLQQATFGANQADVDRLVALGWEGWLNEQFAMPVGETSPTGSHYDYWVRRGKPNCDTCDVPDYEVLQSSFWYQTLEGKDQLRQRVAFALSELFVVSAAASGELFDYSEAMASFHDVLLANSFGNFKVLLEKVSTHPAMAAMLSHRQNDKENAATGRVPDENFSRELMQLFTIGKWMLNEDGTRKKDANGNDIPTYDQNDIMGMAKTMSGWSWSGSDTSEERWFGYTITSGPETGANPRVWYEPLQPYANHHSTSEKTILDDGRGGGRVTIPANTGAAASMDIALTTLFNHPNMGPFIATHLIKSLVTSNPSPAYIGRVAAVFASNKNGIRGDMQAVVRAVLFDAEATDPANLSNPNWGKLREPVVRVANVLRAFSFKSASGRYPIFSAQGDKYHGQNPWLAPTVFNFFYPDYQPPGEMSAQNLVGPEFQIFNEVTSAGYVNYINEGLTFNFSGDSAGNPINPDYSAELAVAGNTTALVTRIAALLSAGNLSSDTRAGIQQAIEAMPSATNTDKLNRVKTAILLVMASPDYLVQK